MRSFRRALRLACAVVGGVIAIVPPAYAVDGTVLISQNTVLAAGGFPYTINKPGSYRLSSNLVAPAGTDGIDITASNVSLDLNGFTIQGGGAALSAGVNNTIEVSGLSVRNGTVTNFDFGIAFGGCSNCVMERLIVNHNNTGGIFSSAVGGSLVSDCIADFNGLAATTGFAPFGLFLLDGGVAKNNTATNNHGPGLWITGGLATGNTAVSNTGVGLQGSLNAGYSNNSFSGNNGGGAQVSGGVNLGHNLCGTVVCP